MVSSSATRAEDAKVRRPPCAVCGRPHLDESRYRVAPCVLCGIPLCSGCSDPSGGAVVRWEWLFDPVKHRPYGWRHSDAHVGHAIDPATGREGLRRLRPSGPADVWVCRRSDETACRARRQR